MNTEISLTIEELYNAIITLGNSRLLYHQLGEGSIRISWTNDTKNDPPL
jgi:hypothetical protein